MRKVGIPLTLRHHGATIELDESWLPDIDGAGLLP
jgi:hypothetical protein